MNAALQVFKWSVLTWLSTGDTINHYVDLHPAYQALRQALSRRSNYGGSQVGTDQRTRAVPD